jgi:hypothetical protein
VFFSDHPVALVEISVDHEAFAVAVANSFSHLDEDVDKLRLGETFREHLLEEDSFVEVLAIDQLHDKTISRLSISVDLIAFNTVGMVKVFKGLGFGSKRSFTDIRVTREDFAHVNSFIFAVSFLNFPSRSATSSSERLGFKIFVLGGIVRVSDHVITSSSTGLLDRTTAGKAAKASYENAPAKEELASPLLVARVRIAQNSLRTVIARNYAPSMAESSIPEEAVPANSDENVR